jgi:hypothetical protein
MARQPKNEGSGGGRGGCTLGARWSRLHRGRGLLSPTTMPPAMRLMAWKPALTSAKSVLAVGVPMIWNEVRAAIDRLRPALSSSTERCLGGIW